MPALTLAAAMEQYRGSIFAPLRAGDPSFTPSADLLRHVDAAFYTALGSQLRHLTQGKWAQFVMLNVAGDVARLDALLHETTSDPEAVLRATLAAVIR